MGLPVDRDNNLQVCVDPPRITAVTLPAVELWRARPRQSIDEHTEYTYKVISGHAASRRCSYLSTVQTVGHRTIT